MDRESLSETEKQGAIVRNIVLSGQGSHRFILLNESEPGEEEGIRSNQYLIMHGEDGVLLDPGGFSTMPRVLGELHRYMDPSRIKAIILSHQDPDIVGGIATWMEIISAPIYISQIWTRFVPHYGLRDMARFRGVPDEGMVLHLSEEFRLVLVPAHFLHSEGQMNVYDPVSGILFTGDIGAGIMEETDNEPYVDDFDRHLPHIEPFHRRYMGSSRAAKTWVNTVRPLAPVMLAPQHGPIYRGESVNRFLDWMTTLECGIDRLPPEGFRIEGFSR